MKIIITLSCYLLTKLNRCLYINKFGYTTNNINEATIVRYILIRTKNHNLFLHKMIRSDRHPMHDHSWDFISFILNGHFWEELVDRLVFHDKKEKFYVRDANTFHRIVLDREYQLTDADVPTTLMFTYRRRKNWNYLVDGVPVKWRKYYKGIK